MNQVHLKKLCVGVTSLQELRDWRKEHKRITGLTTMSHTTRMWPKRSEELLQGGSLFWVVAGVLVCRQTIIGLERVEKDERPACRILLDEKIVEVAARPHRPFQGWRYLKGEEAPPDLDYQAGSASMPDSMKAELADLGLM